jgi:hypothetical protein
MAALTPLMLAATSETSSLKDRPTTKQPIIPPEEVADPLKPLTLSAGFRAPRDADQTVGMVPPSST